MVYRTSTSLSYSSFYREERLHYLEAAIECLDYYINNIEKSGRYLKPCPFCGFELDPSDMDCIYPATREGDIFQVVCHESGGGCSATVLGLTPTDAIKNWNKRA